MNEQLLEVKTLEKQLEMSLKQYNDLNKNITKDNISNASQLNDNILTLIEQIKQKTDLLYPKGINLQKVVKMNNPDLINLSSKLQNDQKELDKMLEQYNSIDGENNNASLQVRKYRIEYLFYIALFWLVITFIIKAYILDGINGENNGFFTSIEYFILLLAILVIVYYVYKYIF